MVYSLKRQLDSEKSKVRKLMTEKLGSEVDNIEMQEFFKSCVEEVKKDIQTRNMHHTRLEITPGRSNRRLGSAPEGIKRSPELSAFTNTDKKKAVELWLSNADLLEQLAEFMFPKKIKAELYKPAQDLIRRSNERAREDSPSHIILKKKRANHISYKPYINK